MLVNAMREPSGDGTPFIAPETTTFQSVPFRCHDPDSRLIFVEDTGRGSVDEDFRSVVEPDHPVNVEPLENIERLAVSVTHAAAVDRALYVANSMELPSGEIAAAVTRFSFTWRVNWRN